MLVEREAQLATLARFLDGHHEGRGQSVTVTGPVASGKTEFLLAFAHRAAGSGAIVLNASASPAERALPFAVLRQLLRGPGPSRDARVAEGLRHPLQALLARRSTADGPREASDQVPARLLHTVSLALLDLVERADAPLVVIVDDAHLADRASLLALHALTERLRPSHALLVVLGESSHHATGTPLAEAEQRPRLRGLPVRLDLLSTAGVAALLAEETGPRGAREQAARYHAVSGGNPLLLRCLIEDSRSHPKATAAATPGPVVGPGFRQALLDMLSRTPPAMLDVARALAVLGESATATRVAQLIDEGTGLVGCALEALHACGVMSAGRFGHPASATAVLDAMTREDRGDLHVRAAHLLHGEGGPARAVARQLLAAEETDGTPAFVPLLHAAADEAIEEGDLHEARGFLRLAARPSPAEPESAGEGEREGEGEGKGRLTTLAMLTRAAWGSDPSQALHHASALLDGEDAGDMTGSQLSAGITPMLWFGRVREAEESLRRLAGPRPEPPADPAHHGYALRLWMRCLYPAPEADGPAAARLPPHLSNDWLTDGRPTTHPLRAVSLMAEALGPAVSEASLERAEKILQEHPLSERTLPLLATAITTLIAGDRLTPAAQWCEVLVAEAAGTGVPTWCAMTSALQAEVALRRADLALAERSARRALTVLSAENWGVAVGLPLGTALEASVALGRHDEALRHLRTPVPDAMFQTPFGLRYLHAKARCHYARGRYNAALEDLETIMSLTRTWRMELTTLVPWHIDVAHTLLRLGQPAHARKVAEELLQLCGPGNTRLRAAALRVLAVEQDSGEQLARLSEVVTMLQGTDDCLELAAALTDLAAAQEAAGQHRQAQLSLRRAQRILRQRGAQQPPRTVIGPAEGGEAGPVSRESEDAGHLTPAEWRVAKLAASGLSNREISGSLQITISTVEQHLTRVYRKLGVRRRSDLGVELQLDSFVG